MIQFYKLSSFVVFAVVAVTLAASIANDTVSGNPPTGDGGLLGARRLGLFDLITGNSDASSSERKFYYCGGTSCEMTNSDTIRLMVNSVDMIFMHAVMRLPLASLGKSRVLQLGVKDFSFGLKNRSNRIWVCKEVSEYAASGTTLSPATRAPEHQTCTMVKLSTIAQGSTLCVDLSALGATDSVNLDVRLSLRTRIDKNLRNAKPWIELEVKNTDDGGDESECTEVQGKEKSDTLSFDRSTKDTFVRGGSFSAQNFGAFDHIAVKSHNQRMSERRGMVHFEPGGSDPQVTLLLTVKDGKFIGHNSQELALCRHDEAWDELSLTFDTFTSDSKRCLYVPLQSTTGGSQVCTTVPGVFMMSTSGSFNFEMIMTSNIHTKPTSDEQSSNDWIAFYSREHPFYDGPQLIHGENVCSSLGLSQSESLLRLEDCTFTTVDPDAAVSLANMPFAENVCYAPLEMIDVVQTFNKRKTALMYTPYDLSIGGGEKYFLEVVSFYISQGYNVILSTHDTNFCKTKDCVLKTAFALRVTIPGDFKYLPVSYRALKRLHANRFDMYYEMGNMRFPEFRNPAVMGVYQCQFPFDLDGPFNDQSVHRLSTFNLVIVNSKFTQSWYVKYSTPALKVMEDENMRYPSIEVIYPPVELVRADESQVAQVKKDPKRLRIVQLGRIFSGRQNKGHKQAIEAIKILNANPDDDVTYELDIIGNIHPRFEEYAHDLQTQAQGHPVKFHFGVPGATLMQLLDEGDVIWHLTGVDITEENSDPASYEHFGISVVEGMSHGLVPVIFSKGGVTEIPGRFGYEISDVQSLVNKTQLAAHNRLDADGLNAMINHVQQFSKPAFIQRLNHVLDRASKSQYFNAMQLPRFPFTCATQIPHDNSAIGTAFIFIHSPGWHIKMIIRNTLHMLGPNWSLAIGYPSYMEEYIRILMDNTMGRKLGQTKLMPLNIQVSSTDAYSHLLMSKSFWDELASPYVLIFQSDSVLLRRPTTLDSIREAYYLGAPWCPSNSILTNGVADHAVGNGGLSLRSSHFMVKCIESLAVKQRMEIKAKVMERVNMSFVKENEDIFFSTCMTELLDEYKIKAAEQKAKSFALEVPCGDNYFNGYPDGLHATWYYVSKEKMDDYIKYSRDLVVKSGRQPESCM